jgi:hypothetical protein
MGLLTLVLAVWSIARLFGVQLPPGVREGFVSLILGGLILVFAVLKTLNDSYSAWPAYLGVVLAALIAYGSWLTFQASGESLPSMSSLSAGGSGQAAPSEPAPPPVAPPPAAPSEPAAGEGEAGEGPAPSAPVA